MVYVCCCIHTCMCILCVFVFIHVCKYISTIFVYKELTMQMYHIFQNKLLIFLIPKSYTEILLPPQKIKDFKAAVTAELEATFRKWIYCAYILFYVLFEYVLQREQIIAGNVSQSQFLTSMGNLIMPGAFCIQCIHSNTMQKALVYRPSYRRDKHIHRMYTMV